MGVLPAAHRDVVVVVDSSAALGGLFPWLLKDYLQPCLEHFCGGALADSSVGLQYGPVQYGLIVVHPPSISYRPPCSFYPITCSAPQLMKWLSDIKFEGGLVERTFHLSEALAAVMEVFTLMESTVDPCLSPDVEIKKQCLFVMGFPPSLHPCVESINFSGKDTDQLMKLLVQRNIALSIVSPRRLPPYLSLFEKGLLATPLSLSPEKKADMEEGSSEGGGEGGEGGVSTAVEKADHSLQKDHLVLLQGFEIQALKSQKKAREPSLTQPSATTSLTDQTHIDIKPSLADFKPPSVTSLGSALGIDQSNPPSVLSTTSSTDAIAMETGQALPTVKQEFVDSAGAVGMATLDAKMPPSVESASKLGLKRSGSPQTGGPGSVGPPSTKSIKLEEDLTAGGGPPSVSSLTNPQQHLQVSNTSQSIQSFATSHTGLSFSGPPVSLSSTATAQVIAASSIGGGNPPLGGAGGVVGRVLGSNIPTSAGSSPRNPIQIASSPVTGPPMVFSTSVAQAHNVVASMSSITPSTSLAPSSAAGGTAASSAAAGNLFSSSQQNQEQVQAGGVTQNQMGQLQNTGNLPTSSIAQHQHGTNVTLQTQPTLGVGGAGGGVNPSTTTLNPGAGASSMAGQQQSNVSSLYGTATSKVVTVGGNVSMTSSFPQGIPPQQQQANTSMATTSVNMYSQQQQQQQSAQSQFTQPTNQTQMVTSLAQRQNLEAARKFAEMAKQQAELQKAGQMAQRPGLQQPGSRPVVPGMTGGMGMGPQQQQQQQQQQTVGGMGMGQNQPGVGMGQTQGGMGMGQTQSGMNVLPGQQQQQQRQAVGGVASSVGSMQPGVGGVTVSAGAFGAQAQRVPTPPVGSGYPASSVAQQQQQQQQQAPPTAVSQPQTNQLLSQQQQQQSQQQMMQAGASGQQQQPQQPQSVGLQAQQPGQPGQVQQQPQARPMVQVVWNGIMELTEMQDNQRQMRQVQCNVVTAKPEVIRDLQPGQWPQRMNMNTYPKALFNSITQLMNFQHGAGNVKTVTFQFLENPQNVTQLRMLMTSEVKTFAIVQLVGVQLTQCPIKALILVWNDRQKQFTGLVPLEQDRFISVLRQVLTAHRQRSMMMQQQAQQVQQAQQGQQTGMQQQMAFQQQQQQPGQPGVTTGQQQTLPQGMSVPGQVGGASTGGGGAPGQPMNQQQQQQVGGASAGLTRTAPGTTGMNQQQLQQLQQQQQMQGQMQQQQQQAQNQAMSGGSQQVGQINQGQQQMHGQMGGVGQTPPTHGGGGPQMAQQQQQQQGQMMTQTQQSAAGGMMPGQPPQGGQQQQQADMNRIAQLNQFIRNIAFAPPQQQEQLLARIAPAKRQQVLLKAQQIRQQALQQQQQQQQAGFNPGGGGGGIMGTGGIQPNLPQSSQPGMNMSGQMPTAVSAMQQQQRPPTMGGMQMQGMMNVQRPNMPPQQQMPPGSGGYWPTQ